MGEGSRKLQGLRVLVEVDGASRGNPGPSAAGFVIRAGKRLLLGRGVPLGEGTNNEAEYRALLMALDEARGLGATEVVVRSDSELVVRQLRGDYRVRNERLRPLWEAARTAASSFRSFEVVHVPRERNRLADRLANIALDRGSSVDWGSGATSGRAWGGR